MNLHIKNIIQLDEGSNSNKHMLRPKFAQPQILCISVNFYTVRMAFSKSWCATWGFTLGD